MSFYHAVGWSLRSAAIVPVVGAIVVLVGYSSAPLAYSVCFAGYEVSFLAGFSRSASDPTQIALY